MYYKQIQNLYDRQKFFNKYIDLYIDPKGTKALMVRDCLKSGEVKSLAKRIDCTHDPRQELWELITYEIFKGNVIDEIVNDLKK